MQNIKPQVALYLATDAERSVWHYVYCSLSKAQALLSALHTQILTIIEQIKTFLFVYLTSFLLLLFLSNIQKMPGHPKSLRRSTCLFNEIKPGVGLFRGELG